MKQYLFAVTAVFLLSFGGALLFLTPAPSGGLSASPSLSETSTQVVPEAGARILFTGDIMLDRYIRLRAETAGYDSILSGVRELLQTSDFVAGNLEGPITHNASVSAGSDIQSPENFKFTFASTTAQLLSSFGFGLVSIGNNHIYNFGGEGVRETKKYLVEAGIAYVGDPLLETTEPMIKLVNGIKIAFVSYNQFVGNDAPRALLAIRNAHYAGADAVVVLAHWSEEYETAPTLAVRELAHELVDEGADVIIGTHSHVIGEQEDYNGARIYYSLGNFVFDQYWNPQVRCGLVVRTDFAKKGTTTTISYTETTVGQRRDGTTALGCE